MSNELKPCPFCGSTDIDTPWGMDGMNFVRCNNCGVFGPDGAGKNGAIKAWNRRTPSDHIVAANKKVDDSQPLTMEEIRGMAGEPVWVETFGMWALVYIHGNWDPHLMLGDGSPVLNHPARNHTLYRRKPEGD